MSTVFFKLSDQLSKNVETFMKKEGYTSKAEFFRFLIKYYDIKQKSHEQVLFEEAEQELADVLMELDRQGKIPNKSIEEQLADV